MRVIHHIMAVKEIVLAYNAMLFASMSYLIPFYDEVLCISSIKFISFIGRLLGSRVFIYGDEFNPNEKATVLSNHKSMYDIFAIFYVSGYFNKIIGICSKKQVAYVPGIGWWCTRMKFPMLNRNISDLKILEADKTPFPIVICPEGTRYSEQKYKESYQFAKQNDYPISKYAQVPKYKGAFALSNDIVYHMTLVYMDNHQRIITGEIKELPRRIYIHVKKHTNVPRDESEYKKWIQNQFASIDDIYDNFNPTNSVEMTPNFQPLDYVLYTIYVGLHAALGYWLL
jgi:1-acyl-sn-glycerol-3-phosphate acyltransferase